MSDEKLKQCPFCGSEDIAAIYHKDQYFMHYGCCFCAADGPIVRLYGISDEEAEQKAKKLWNERAGEAE